MSKTPSNTEVKLPAIVSSTASALEQVTNALNVPREILASDQEIAHAWSELPRLLNQIPPALRSEQHARMCVAVSAGLFDAAINYVWNSAVLELREKVRRFGLNVVEQLTGKDFDEDSLVDLKDAELLELCLKLNLISEDAFFFLDQCRDVRNNFSTAHPPMGNIDDDEFIVFLKRCAKYALSETSNPTGVDTQALISSIKKDRFSSTQTKEWCQRIANTHDLQRDLIFSTLHGIFCDPKSAEEARRNALDISKDCATHFSPKTRSALLNRHSDYIADGETDRQTASRGFFEELGLISLLTDAEQHTIISAACTRLVSVHQGMNNFYNEPPFAERLLELTTQVAVPNSAQSEFVVSVLTCAVGNPYGVSNAAYDFYCEMISNFSPRELSIMFKLPRLRTVVGRRIREVRRCKEQFKEIVRECVDADSVPTGSKKEYERWARA